MILLVDNYDSFTFNLYQYLGELGAEVKVVRNDAMSASDALALRPDRIVISPGPCTPAEAGISVELIRLAAERGIATLGVCLGHQAIGAAFGGRVVRAARPMHGKVTPVRHDGTGLFAGLDDPLPVMRYHSLVVEEEGLPSELVVTAYTRAGEIMGLRHATLPHEGVQFHPESVLTPHGVEFVGGVVGRREGLEHVRQRAPVHDE